MKILTIVVYAGFAALAMGLMWMSTRLWPPPLGIQLGGGIQTVYDVCPLEHRPGNSNSLADIDWATLTAALKVRIDPAGTRETWVRRIGREQIEIIIPAADMDRLPEVRSRVGKLGELRFRIVANPSTPRHAEVIALAKTQSADAALVSSKYVFDGDEIVGFWGRVQRTDPAGSRGSTRLTSFETMVFGHVIRDTKTGRVIAGPPWPWKAEAGALEKYLAQEGVDEVEMLLVVEQTLEIDGSHLRLVYPTFDDQLKPCMNFQLSEQGAMRMKTLTGGNLPDPHTGLSQQLAIVIDGTIVSAPRLRSAIGNSGVITGDFSQQQVDEIVDVLRSGKLPARLSDIPFSELTVDPSPTSRRTALILLFATVGGLILIWAILLLRHGLLGIGAFLASLLQLLLTTLALLVFVIVVTPASLSAAAVTLLAFAVALLWICEAVYRASATYGKIWIASRTPAAATFLVAITTSTLSAVAYAIGDFPVRSTALPIMVALHTGVFLSICCLLPPIAALTESTHPSPTRAKE